MNIDNLIGMSGGSDAAYWKIVAEVERGLSTYYPAIVDGQEKSWSEFSDLDKYLAHKVKRQRMTVRLLIIGNPVAAEETVAEITGCRCLSTGPNTLDIYIEQPEEIKEDLLTVDEAVELSASQGKPVAAETLRWGARRGLIEGAQKTGRDWVIPRSGLLTYLNAPRKPGPKSS